MPGTVDNASREGVVLAHTLNGSPVQGVGGLTHAEGNIQPAYGYSTARYISPAERKANTKAHCASEGCTAWPMKGLDYCVGHARSLGLFKPKGEELEPS